MLSVSVAWCAPWRLSWSAPGSKLRCRPCKISHFQHWTIHLLGVNHFETVWTVDYKVFRNSILTPTHKKSACVGCPEIGYGYNHLNSICKKSSYCWSNKWRCIGPHTIFSHFQTHCYSCSIIDFQPRIVISGSPPFLGKPSSHQFIIWFYISYLNK